MGSKKTSKSPKSDEKKGKKQPSESAPPEEKKDDHESEQPAEGEPDVEQTDQENQDTLPSTTPAESDRFSDEPTLTELIVESFEGERERGYFEGFGIATFTNGNVYEGNFTEGMMHGIGKYTWTANSIVYEGDFYHNQITGKGVYCWPDGSCYEGDVLNGTRHGTGTFRHPSGLSYSGQWDMAKRNGEGRLEYNAEGTSYYEGEWRTNIRHGYGFRQYLSGNVYEGMWYNGLRHGQGTMRWMDRDEMYTGQWEDGVQNGMGQYMWFVRRIKGSQYPLRNIYDGEFVKGQRQGFGEFYYPNGARFEGEWKNNLKCGQGKFVFKNGRIYEGEFENDRIKEYPNLCLDGRETPDLTDIRTRSPAPFEMANSVHSKESYNTVSPSFQLYINHILGELPEHYDTEEETQAITNALFRHYGGLRRIYNFYSALGNLDSQDNTFVMNQMQFWRFMKDCKFHHHEGLSLTEIDRFLAISSNQTSHYEVHNPTKRILFLQFVNHIVNLSYLIYKEKFKDKTPLLSQCLIELVTRNILPHAGQVRGFVFSDSKKSNHAMQHIEKAYSVYQRLCKPRKEPLQEPVLTMRHFLFMLKDNKLINEDLTAATAVNILSADDPEVADNDFINLEREMTFLEFFEALVGCAAAFVTDAVIKDPTTPTSEVGEKAGLERPSASSPPGSVSNMDAGGTPDVATVVSESPATGHQLDSKSPGETGGSSSRQGEEKPHSERGSRKGRGKHSDSKKADRLQSDSHSTTQQAPPPPTQPIKEDPSPASVEPPSEPEPEIGDDVFGVTPGADAVSAASEPATLDDVDEATRAFNFWTHQIHIFFMRKLFPAADRLAVLGSRIAQRILEEEMEARKQRMLEEAKPEEEEVAPEHSVQTTHTPSLGIEVRVDG